MMHPTPAMDKIRSNLAYINRLIDRGWTHKQIREHLRVSGSTWDKARKEGLVTRKRKTKSKWAMAARHGINVGKIDMHSMSDEAIQAIATYAHRHGLQSIAEAMQEISLDAIAEGRLDVEERKAG